MKRSFGKTLLFELLAAALSTLTMSVAFALLAMENTNFLQAYVFYLVLTAPAFLALGAPISAVIRTAGRSYGVNLLAYAVAGAAAMYAYLATVLNGLQVHTSRDVGTFLVIGAVSALCMYHISIALERSRMRNSKAGA
jgi:cation transport ATPase